MKIFMKKKMSLSNKVIFALIAGILFGLIFGDLCSFLKPFGNIFIKIMQITVIPYIIVSLLHAIGGLTKEKVKSIAIKGSTVLLILWVISIVIFFAMQFTFPALEFASSFSSTIPDAQSINYVDLFIPSNFFASLANNAIPAIIIFCILLGISFISVESKAKIPALNFMNLLCKCLETITNMLITIIPYGIFFITANAAGTVTRSNVSLLAIFIIGYIVCSLFVVLLVIPLILSSTTKFTYYDILSETKGVLIFTLVTGNLFISLPYIVESIKNIYTKYNNHNDQVDTQTKLLIPIYYTFPGIGKLSIMFFILFIAWLYDHHLTILDQIKLGSVGLFSLFGSPYLAIPFLLKLLRLPSDAFSLYLASSQVLRKFALMLDVMGLFSCTVICISLYTNFFKLQIWKLLKSVALIAIIFIVMLFGLRFFFSSVFSDLYEGDKLLQSMVLPKTYKGENYSDVISTKVYTEIPKHLLATNAPISGKKDTLEQIKERKVLRVGYNTNSMPYNYFNKNGNLVGYDIQMAYELAIFMNCPNIEFIPIQTDSMTKMLNNRICDIIMSPVYITQERMSRMMYTSSHMTQRNAFVVKDYRKAEFSTVKNVKNIRNLKIAVIKGHALIPLIREVFSNAEVIEINDLNVFFKENIADALATQDTEAYAWTLMYPYYDVAIITYKGRSLKRPIAYPIATDGGESFRLLLNVWLDMLKTNGLLSKYHDYWILGKKEPQHQPKRWSVMRNILNLTP